MTLTEFLLARVAEDEAEAHENTIWIAGKGPWRLTECVLEGISVIAIDARRVLAECEAKRRIVERYLFIAAAEGETTELAFHEQGLFEAVTLLAAAYADHPDYREEWRP